MAPDSRLVIIASDFPPLAGTNTQRVQSFVKYLPDFGWKPFVVTRAVEDMALIDSSQLSNIPADLAICRLVSPDPFLWLKRRRQRKPRDIAITASTEDAPSHSSSERAPAQGKRRIDPTRLLKLALRYLAYIPDDQMPWAMAAARIARRQVLQQNASAILTSCPTYSSHVAGLLVKRSTRIFWVADFRDLWVGRPGRSSPSRWHAFWDRLLERLVAKHADHIIVASPPWKERLCQRHGLLESKISVITNGFDSSKMPGSAELPPRPESDLVFVNTGAMYGSESPAPFLQALGELLTEHPEFVSHIQIRLIGYAGDEQPQLEFIVKQHGLQEIVHFLGPQPHHRCLAEQAQADILLLFNAPQHAETIRGKSFEYMATGKPILALIPQNGAQAELLNGARTAHIVQHGDVVSTRRKLWDLISCPTSRTVNPDWDYIRQFERRSLTRHLADILDRSTNLKIPSSL